VTLLIYLLWLGIWTTEPSLVLLLTFLVLFNSRYVKVIFQVYVLISPKLNCTGLLLTLYGKTFQRSLDNFCVELMVCLSWEVLCLMTLLFLL